jgi:site-specific recombinase XerD
MTTIDSHASVRIWVVIATSIREKKSSREEYRVQLAKWLKFLGGEVGDITGARVLVAATSLDVRHYREHLQNESGMPSRDGHKERSRVAAPATVRKKLSMLRSLYRDLQEEGLVPHNPFLMRLMPSIEFQKRPTEMIPFSKVWELINAPASPAHTTPTGEQPTKQMIARDRAMLSLMFGCGLRLGELIGLRLCDVKKSQSGIVYLRLLNTKKGCDDTQPVPDWAGEILDLWIQSRIEFGATPNDPLFCALRQDTGAPRPGGLSRSTVPKIFKKYVEMLGLDPKIYSPHSARATAISKLLEQGVPHREVKEFSRHNDIAMVELYDKRRVELDENPGRDIAY